MRDYILIPKERIRILKENKSVVSKITESVPIKLQFNDAVCVEGEDAIMVMRCRKVIEAFGRGFNMDDALALLDEKYFLEIIRVGRFSKSKKRQKELKGRVIGTKGKMKRFIENMCNVKIVVYGKTISILGEWENVVKARKAVEMLLSGSPHNTVYRFLELGIE